MKLVIDIDEGLYKAICDCDDIQILSHFAIKHGTPYEERPYGKWIRQSESRTIFFCSNCGREINTTPFTRTDNFPYCHCGADMRRIEGGRQ